MSEDTESSDYVWKPQGKRLGKPKSVYICLWFDKSESTECNCSHDDKLTMTNEDDKPKTIFEDAEFFL